MSYYRKEIVICPSKWRAYIVCPAFLVVLLFFMMVPKAHSDEYGVGSVDLVVQDSNKIVLQGWAGAYNAAQKISSISVYLSDKKIYDGPFERNERTDVVSATRNKTWLKSGWRLSILLPDYLRSGVYQTKVIANLDSGQKFVLSTNDVSRSIKIDSATDQQRLFVKLVKILIALVLLFLLVLFVYAEFIAKSLSSKIRFTLDAPKLFGLGLVFSFLVFLGIGLTGSSFSTGLQQSSFIQGDMINISGQNQPIRSDEWLVLTPLAIAQFNHTPRNPMVNNNHGENGQNMLIVGMTGVPVHHISAIAKPATWGYFIFDLKRALAWNWLFPIFSCLIALWAVVSIVMPGHWRASFLISLLFSSTPYVVGWSNWPAYAVFFPSLIFVCANFALRTEFVIEKLLISVLLGLAFAGFVLVLYPPWQICLAYIFMALIVGVVIRDRLYRSFNFSSLCAVLLAVLVAGAILLPWWLDAKSAIEAMENTVYPGQRTTVVGGTLTLPSFLRGFTNIITLQNVASPFTNQSEVASFQYLLLPLALLFLIRLFQKSLTAVEVSLAVAISLIIGYMFIGIPVGLAKYSLWGRVPEQRADLALGLACLILSGSLLIRKPAEEASRNLIKAISFFVSVVWAFIVYKSLGNLDETVLVGFTSNLMFALFVTVTALGYFLCTGNFKSFVVLSLAFAGSTTFSFNPINVAPSKLINSVDLAELSGIKNPRVLVLENMTPAMYLLASGNGVANGIFYYPQTKIWARMDPNGEESDVYNRYQHLVYTAGKDLGSQNFSIQTPQADVVKVEVDLELFDFSLSGADLVVAPVSDRGSLEKNMAIDFLSVSDNWVWFSIKK